MEQLEPKKAVCVECGKEFLAFPTRFGTYPKRCPDCLARLHAERGGYQVTRKLLERVVVNAWVRLRLDSLPANWEKVQIEEKHHSRPAYKIDFKGREFGASWSGRIVMWADEPILPGNLVDLEQMEARYQVCVSYETHHSVGAAYKGYDATYTIRKHLPLTECQEELDETTDPSGPRSEVDSHVYYRMRPARDGQATGRLVYVEGTSKTTLKGLGAQYHVKITIPPDAEVLSHVHGHYRSGRAGGDGYLLVLPLASKIIVMGSGCSGSGDCDDPRYNWTREV